MSDRLEMAIIVLVMAAAGLILVAPVVGRGGAPGWADALMGLAAGAGVGAFVLVAVHTCRAARHHGTEEKGEDH
jgi:hypothetical protein